MTARQLLSAALLAAAGLTACAEEDPRVYDNNDLQLVTGYSAKEMCSCLFVAELDEAACRAWTYANPAVADIRVDAAQKTVEASALLLWGAKARFVGEKFGCVIE